MHSDVYSKGLEAFNDQQLADEVRNMHRRRNAAVVELNKRGYNIYFGDGAGGQIIATIGLENRLIIERQRLEVL